MSVRMTEEEYAELMRRRGEGRGRFLDSGCASAQNDGKTGGRRIVAAADAPKRSKYGNTRVEIDGKKFDSIHEAQVYDELMGRWMAGQLQVVMRQVPFDLPGGIKYVADFCTVDKDGRFEVLDAKSSITKRNRVYINKKKQMHAIWGLDIKEV